MKLQPHELRIKVVAQDLILGLGRAEIIAKHGEEWRSSPRTFDRYIMEAKKIAETTVAKADKIIEETTIDVLKDAAIGGLRAAIEVDKRIQDIIFNKHILVRTPDVTDINGRITSKGKVIKVDNTTSDVLKAAALYYRRHNLLGKDEDLTKRKIKITITGRKKGNNQDGTSGA